MKQLSLFILWLACPCGKVFRPTRDDAQKYWCPGCMQTRPRHDFKEIFK